MSLTIARLDEMAAENRRHFVDLEPENMEEVEAQIREWLATIDYARERAAREKCEAVGQKPGLVSLIAIANADDTCRYLAEWIVPFITLASSGEYETPTAAYLALVEALAKR